MNRLPKAVCLLQERGCGCHFWSRVEAREKLELFSSYPYNGWASLSGFSGCSVSSHLPVAWRYNPVSVSLTIIGCSRKPELSRKGHESICGVHRFLRTALKLPWLKWLRKLIKRLTGWFESSGWPKSTWARPFTKVPAFILSKWSQLLGQCYPLSDKYRFPRLKRSNIRSFKSSKWHPLSYPLVLGILRPCKRPRWQRVASIGGHSSAVVSVPLSSISAIRISMARAMGDGNDIRISCFWKRCNFINCFGWMSSSLPAKNINRRIANTYCTLFAGIILTKWWWGKGNQQPHRLSESIYKLSHICLIASRSTVATAIQ